MANDVILKAIRECDEYKELVAAFQELAKLQARIKKVLIQSGYCSERDERDKV